MLHFKCKKGKKVMRAGKSDELWSFGGGKRHRITNKKPVAKFNEMKWKEKP